MPSFMHSLSFPFLSNVLLNQENLEAALEDMIKSTIFTALAAFLALAINVHSVAIPEEPNVQSSRKSPRLSPGPPPPKSTLNLYSSPG